MPWQKGQSGNPKGRAPVKNDVAAMAREWTPECIAALGRALSRPQHAVAAAQALLDRGWGKAPLVVETGSVQSLTMLMLLASREAGERLQQLYQAAEQNGKGQVLDSEDKPVLTIDYTEPASE